MHTKILPLIIITLISVTIIALLSTTGIFKSITNTAYDYRIRHFSPKTNVSGRIVMVWLDESTMDALPYRSPVPRDFLKKLNDKLVESTPSIIAYDIFFQDPTSTDMDSTLAESLSRWEIYSVSAGKDNTNDALTEERPLKIFRDSLSGYGLSDLPISAYDTVVRKFRPYWIIGGKKRPTFAALIYKAATGNDAEAVIKDMSMDMMGIEFKAYHETEDGHMWSLIRYAGRPSIVGEEGNAFPVFPAYLVAAGLIPEHWFYNKIVLVGSAYEYSQDAFVTPLFGKRSNYSRMNGVEIHTNILNDLLMRQFFYFPDFKQLIVLLIFLSAFASYLALRLQLLRSIIIIVLAGEIFFFINILLLKKLAIVVPLIAPIAAMILGFGLSLIWRATTEGRQKKFIKNVFSKYVSSSVAKHILEDPSKLVLGGETRDITSLFTDIESFTTISEKLPPNILVDFLNEYLSRLSDIIFKHGGTVDKYEGDAVIAFFGAPLDLPKHEESAVKAAIEIQKATKEISEKWKETCGREIITRIGINSGPAVVGNMGSEGRFDYTAIGDTVNLASRLEGTNKKYGTRVLISESTKEALPNEIECKYIDEVRVKGKNEAIRIYSFSLQTSLRSLQ